MRHLGKLSGLSTEGGVHIFGAAAGGKLLRGLLESSGIAVAGFIDDFVTGDMDCIPVRTVDAFFAQAAGTEIILISSGAWAAIGAMLEAHGATLVFNAWPLVHWPLMRKQPALSAGAAERLRDATGMTIHGIVAELSASGGPSPPIRHINDLGSLPPERSVYLWGPLERTRRLAAAIGAISPSCILGFVDPARPASPVIDQIAAHDVPGFLQARNDDAIILAVGMEPAAKEHLARHGISDILDISALAEERDNLPLPGLSRRRYDGQSPPRVAIIRSRHDGAPLLDALRTQDADLIAWCGDGPPPSPAIQARAAALFQSDSRLGAIVFRAETGRAQSFPLTLVDLACKGEMPVGGSWFVSRDALHAIGIDRDDWTADDNTMLHDLWLRLFARCDIRWCDDVIPLPDAPHPLDAAGVSLERVLASLAALVDRLFHPAGPFVGGEPVRRACLLSLFATIHDHAAARGGGLGRFASGIQIGLPGPDASVYKAFAQFHEQRGQIDQALAVWDQASHLGDETVDSLANQAALKSPGENGRSLLARHIRWAARHAVSDPLPPEARKREAGHRIRIGYFFAHAAADYVRYQIIPFMRHHDRSRFEILAYTAYDRPSYLTEATERVRLVHGMDNAEFLRVVRADDLDILVDVTGFSPMHRFAAMGARCARIQAIYCNHTGTTGVPNIDYVIADEVAAPRALDPDYTEKIFRLDELSFFCFAYDDTDLPPVRPAPFHREGRITLGCFGSAVKLNPVLLGQWARILHAIPGSRLYLRNTGLSHAANRHHLQHVLAGHGIGPDRLLLKPGTDRMGILESYDEVDISLDTWPYCGGNTIAESLAQGVPVISRQGETFASCYGASLLAASGCGNLVARDWEEYIALAVSLAADGARLDALRTELRAMTRQNGFADPERFARKMERAFVAMLNSVGHDVAKL